MLLHPSIVRLTVPALTRCNIHQSSNFGWSKILVGTTLGWFFGGTIHSRRKEKKLQKKHKEEQKALYTQYYNDVYTLQEQNTELAEALEKLGVRVTR